MDWMSFGRPAALKPVAAVVVLTLSLTACSGSGPSSSNDNGKPTNGGTITVGTEGEVDTLLPGASQWATTGVIESDVIFSSLMAPAKDGSYVPMLAKSLSPNADFTKWTLKLRPGLKFSDGSPLNANALKADFDRYLTAKGASSLSYLTYGDKVVTMQVVDPLTVTYTLPQTDASFPYVLTLDPGQPFSAAAADAAGKDAGLKPIGAGPYMIKSWTHGDKLVLVPNPNYFQKGATHLDQLIFRPIADDTSRLTAFQSGGVQAMFSEDEGVLSQLQTMDQSGSATLRTFTGDSIGGNVINTAKPPFDDLRVRRALVEATNFKDLDAVMGDSGGFAKPSTQPFDNSSPWYSSEAASKWPTYDESAAKADLKAYINDPTRSDGKPVGSPVSFSYQCQPTAQLSQLAQTYQSEWNKVGFDMKIDSVEQAAMIGNVVGSADSKPAWVGNFDVACWRFSADPDPVKLVNDFGATDTVLNFTNYTDATLTKAIADLRSTTDLAKRKQAAATISMDLAQQLPEQFVSPTVQGVAFGPKVHGASDIALPDGATARPIVSGSTIDWSSLWLSK